MFKMRHDAEILLDSSARDAVKDSSREIAEDYVREAHPPHMRPFDHTFLFFI